MVVPALCPYLPRGCVYIDGRKPSFLAVAVLEIIGTAYEVWSWPDSAFGVFPILKSHNPPSGISLFYFLLDIGCFVMYTQFNRKTWKRFKNIRGQLKSQII